MRTELPFETIVTGYGLTETTGPAPMYYGSGYIGKGDFWKFGLIFGVIFFAGLLIIVLPWLELIGNKL